MTFTSLSEFSKKERSSKPSKTTTTSNVSPVRPKSSLFSRDKNSSSSVSFVASSESSSVSLSSLIRKKKDPNSEDVNSSEQHHDRLGYRSSTPVMGQTHATPSRKAPKKPAPPAPSSLMSASLNESTPMMVSPSLLRKSSFGSSSITSNNNNDDQLDSWSSRQSPSLKTFASRLSVHNHSNNSNSPSPGQSTQKNTGITSSSETLDCSSDSGSSSVSARNSSHSRVDYDTRSLDRREVLRRNNSDKSSTSVEGRMNRKHQIFRRSLLPVQRPSVPPPARPPLPSAASCPSSRVIERQKSVDDLLTKQPSLPTNVSESMSRVITRSHDLLNGNEELTSNNSSSSSAESTSTQSVINDHRRIGFINSSLEEQSKQKQDKGDDEEANHPFIVVKDHHAESFKHEEQSSTRKREPPADQLKEGKNKATDVTPCFDDKERDADEDQIASQETEQKSRGDKQDVSSPIVSQSKSGEVAEEKDRKNETEAQTRKGSNSSDNDRKVEGVGERIETDCKAVTASDSSLATDVTLTSEGIPKKPPRRNKQQSSPSSQTHSSIKDNSNCQPSPQQPQHNIEISHYPITCPPNYELIAQQPIEQTMHDRLKREEFYQTNPFVDSGVSVTSSPDPSHSCHPEDDTNASPLTQVIEPKDLKSLINPFVTNSEIDSQQDNIGIMPPVTVADSYNERYSSTDGSLDEWDVDDETGRGRGRRSSSSSSSSGMTPSVLPVPKPRKPPRKNKSPAGPPVDSTRCQQLPVVVPPPPLPASSVLDLKHQQTQDIISQVDLYDNNNLPSPPSVTEEDVVESTTFLSSSQDSVCLRNNKPPKPMPPPKPRMSSVPVTVDTNTVPSPVNQVL